jgi:hypothetical protein
MTDSAEQAVAKAEAATQKAEAAAVKAERAARRPGYLLAAGFLFALVGAVLAFALKDSDASVLGVSLEPLGGVLFAAGVLLIAGGAIGSMRLGDGNGDPGGGGGANANSIKTIGGLLAVLAGITAVTALAIVTLTRLGSENKESMIAVTSSAFGIISAVVGAYLGIKITADSASKTNQEAKNAAVAEHEVKVAKHQVSAIEETVKDKDPGLAEEAKSAGQEAREEVVAQTIHPPQPKPLS